MKTIVMTQKTMAPRNMVKVLSSEVTNVEEIIEAQQYFLLACRSVVGYRQIQEYLTDRGYKVMIQILPKTLRTVTEDVVEVDSPASSFDWNIEQPTTASFQMTQQDLEDQLEFSAKDEDEDLFGFINAFCEQHTVYTFDSARLQLQAAITLDKYTEDAGTKGQFDIQLRSGERYGIQYPLPRGTSKLSKTMHLFYMEWKGKLSDNVLQQLREYMVAVNEAYIDLCETIVKNRSNFYFVPGHTIADMEIFGN